MISNLAWEKVRGPSLPALRRCAVVLVPAVAGLALLLALRSSASSFGGALGEGAWSVTSSEDDGPGSLREALFAANAHAGPARIDIRVPDIRIESPLPPLANPHGVMIFGDSVLLESDGIPGPLLTVRSPRSLLRDVRVRAPGRPCVAVHAADVTFIAVETSDCSVGIDVLSGAAGPQVLDSRFVRNAIGMRLPAFAGGSVLRSSFTGHTEAGIWSVGPVVEGRGSRLEVSESRFADNRRGLVLGNRASRLVRNEFTGSLDAGIYLLGSGAVVEDNRVRGGPVGIIVEGGISARLARNEVDHNTAMGILVSSSSDSELRDNRSYENGYGIVVVFGDDERPNLLSGNQTIGNGIDGLAVLGGSPLVRGNRSFGNGGAGVRIYDVVLGGETYQAKPFLRGNQWRGNAMEVSRGMYEVK